MLISVLFFLLLNLIIVLTAILICFLLKINNKLVFLTAIIIVYFSLIIFTITVLGALNILNTLNYVLWMIIIFLAVLFLFFRNGQNHKNLLVSIQRFWSSILLYQKVLFFILMMLLIFWVVRLAITPIWDYDSIAYHLPFAVQFIQDGSINHVYFTALSGPIGYYPSNIEIIFASYLLIFNHDSVLHIINLLLIIGYIFVLRAILREFKTPPLIMVLAILTFLTIPVYVFQIGTLKIDNFFTFVFVSMILFLYRYYLNRKFSDLLLFSLGCGIFIGSRYLAIPYVLLPLLFILIIFIADFVKGKRRTVIKSFILFILAVSILGGFWYVRNFLITENFIFPTSVSFLGHNILSGLNDNFSGKTMITTSIFSHINNFVDIKNFIKRYLFEVGFIAPLFLVFFAFAIIYIKNNFSKLKTPLFIFTIISVPLYFGYYLCLPNSFIHLNQNIRYSLPFLFFCLLGIIFIARTLNKKFINKFLIYSLGTTIILNLLLIFINNQPQVVFGENLNKKISQREIFYNRLKTTYGGASDLFNVMAWIDDNIDDRANIGYSGFHLHYPLFGEKLKRKVDYIAAGKCFNCNYYDFKFSNGDIFANSNYESWLSNINYYEKEYYAFFNQLGYPDVERHWLEQHPDQFQLLYRSGGAVVYKIKSISH